MAQDLDGEFWLPSEFLTDEDLLTDFKTDGFGFSSDISSPVESVIGSTETESDEDDLITELTRKIAQSTLQDPNFSSDYAAEGCKLSGSPQSTLCGYKQGSCGRPNFGGWDQMYAAAGEIAKMRMIEETSTLNFSNKFFVSPPESKSLRDIGFYTNQSRLQAHIAYLQLQASQFQQMKHQQEMMRSGVWGKIDFQMNNSRAINSVQGEGLSQAAWPTLQQAQQHHHHRHHQTGSAIRLGFLGRTGVKQERTGTGVFLPRRVGSNASETKKKSDAAVLKHNKSVSMDEQRNLMMNPELRLPQEWTY